MTDDERDTLEAKAERALRRGELSEAFALFSKLIAAFPEDTALAQRVAELRENLQPLELANP